MSAELGPDAAQHFDRSAQALTKGAHADAATLWPHVDTRVISTSTNFGCCSGHRRLGATGSAL